MTANTVLSSINEFRNLVPQEKSKNKKECMKMLQAAYLYNILIYIDFNITIKSVMKK